MERYIFPFLWLHGEDEHKLREYMNVIRNAGCRAVCLESRPHPDFCGDRWWHDLDVILDEAKKLGMKIWILDDSHFPTGYANGAALSADTCLRRQSIYTHCYSVRKGQRSIHLNVKKIRKAIPSTLMSRIVSARDKAARQIFDDDRLLSISAWIDGEDKPIILRTEAQQTNHRLRLDLPENTRKVYVTFLTRNAGIHKSYINMMDEESCRLLIDAVHEPHFAHYAEEFGKTILGFFSDEPELGNGVYFDTNVRVGTDHDFPWSRSLEQELRLKFGDDFPALLPLLWDDGCNKDLASYVRYTYMDAVTRLVEKNFSQQIGGWCRAHGVEYIGHMIEDNNAHARTGSSLGHYFRGLSGQHMAGIDDIGGQVLPFSEDVPAEGIYKLIGGRDGEFYHFMLGKLAGSMAYLQPEKQGRAMCEIFGNYGWGEGPRMEKYLADHFMVQGINHFVPHAFSPKAYPDRDCPPHFYANGHNPQYRAFGQVIAYMNGICELISDGKPVLETAVLYHGDAEWAGDAMLSQKPCRELMEHQIDFQVIPCDVFEEPLRYHTCYDGGFSVNGNRYKQLIIPYARYLCPSLSKALDQILKAGCQLYFIDALLDRVVGGLELPSCIRQCQVISIGELSSRCSRDAVIEPSNIRMRIFHYRKSAKEFYYLVNEDDQPYHGTVTIPACESLAGYDPWRDQPVRLHYCRKEDKSAVEIQLRSSESLIIFIGENTATEEYGIFETAKDLEITEDLSQDFRLSTCKAVDYPHFSKARTIHQPEDYARTDRTFSGYLAYEKVFHMERTSQRTILEITDAGEDVEVFLNGKSLGIQVLPPFLYDITEEVQPGDNILRIEVATTLERENRANRHRQAPTGLTGSVRLRQSMS